jgi:phosphate transport system protein
MPREEFQRELDALRDEVVTMGDVVSTRLQKAFTALETQNRELAQRLVDSDHQVNELYLDLEQQCIDLFALQQPVASDLRFIAASFKIITDLERIADLAANFGTYVYASEPELLPDVDLVSVGQIAVSMLDDAMAAYADGEADACFEVANRDDDLDGRCEQAAQQVIRALVERDPDPGDFESLLTEVNRILLTVRDIERIGDHAVNIAARTLYMVDFNDALLY